MIIIHYELGRILMEERIAQAERARQRSRFRRHRDDRRRVEADVSRDADVVEVVFGTHCGIDKIGA